MQWSPDRNAGFSRSDPEGLYLPPIMDPIYGYNAVNVEAQQRDRSSLLSWMTRLLQIRTSQRAFGRGTLRFIRPGNRKVLCYVREVGDEIVLCVVNLSRSAQPVELWLGEFKGMVPVELLGRTAFPPIGELPYLLSLPSYGFFWFRLSANTAAPSWHEERLAPEDAPVLVMSARWDSIFPDRLLQWRGAEATKLRARLEGQLLPAYVSNQRWYASKGSPVTTASLGDHVQWQGEQGQWLLAMFDVRSGGSSAPCMRMTFGRL
jgi:maltose alpha-D-glucosyltransferase/alpha-amylase